MKNIKHIRIITNRILTLIVAPLTITLLGQILLDIINQKNIPDWYIYSFVILFLLFLLLYQASFTDKFEKFFNTITRFVRKQKFKKPTIYIIDGTIENEHEHPPRPAQSTKTVSDWYNDLRDEISWKVNRGPLKRIIESPPPLLIINPFGEAYPEEDPTNKTSFKEICDYVKNGGVFVNVAGIPFWYNHNPRNPDYHDQRVTSHRLDQVLLPGEAGTNIIAKPLIYEILRGNVSLSESQIVNGVQNMDERDKFDEIAGVGGNPQLTMFRAYPLGTPDMLPILRSENPDNIIIGSLKYGEGFFIFAGVQINEDNISYEKVIAAIKGWVKYESQR